MHLKRYDRLIFFHTQPFVILTQFDTCNTEEIEACFRSISDVRGIVTIKKRQGSPLDGPH